MCEMSNRSRVGLFRVQASVLAPAVNFNISTRWLERGMDNKRIHWSMLVKSFSLGRHSKSLSSQLSGQLHTVDPKLIMYVAWWKVVGFICQQKQREVFMQRWLIRITPLCNVWTWLCLIHCAEQHVAYFSVGCTNDALARCTRVTGLYPVRARLYNGATYKLW